MEGSPGPPVEDAEERSLARRLRDRREILGSQLDATRRRLEDSRPRSGLVDTVFRAIDVDTQTGGGVLSAAVAFRVFLFLVPYVFFVVVGVGFLSDATKGSPNALSSSAGITGLVAGAVKGAAELSTGERLTALLVSGLALALGARALLKVLRITHGLMWRVPIAKPKSLNRQAVVLVGLITLVLAAGGAITSLREQGAWLWVLGLGLSAMVPGAVWFVVSWHLPHAAAPRWAMLPGAALIGFGTVVLHAATVYFFAYEVEKKSDTYGAIGVALALLLWAYLLGRIVTLSAAVNAGFWYRNEGRLGHEVPEELDLADRLAGPVPTADPVEPGHAS